MKPGLQALRFSNRGYSALMVDGRIDEYLYIAILCWARVSTRSHYTLYTGILYGSQAKFDWLQAQKLDATPKKCSYTLIDGQANNHPSK